MIQRRRSLHISVAVLATLATLAACSSDTKATTAGAAGTTSSGSTSASGTTTAGAAGTTTSGSTSASGTTTAEPTNLNTAAVFRFVASAGLDTFDTAKTAASGFELLYWSQVYEPLFRINPQTKQPEPRVAKSSSWSSDNLTLTIDLRDGVKFSDGTPLDAAAVKANIERYQSLKAPLAASQLKLVSSVDAADPLTVKLHLSSPDSALLFNLTLTAGMMVSPAAFNNPDLDRHPIGAGPFVVSRMDPNSLVVYKKNPTYWDPASQHIAGIEISYVVDANARYNALRTGQADAVWMGTTDLYSQAKSDGYPATDFQPTGYLTLYLNNGKAIADLRVRQAIMYAIDRPALAKVVVPLGGPRIQPYPQDNPYADPTITADQYPLNIAKAKQLLADAGYASGLNLTMVFVQSNFPDAPPLIKDMLSKVGINLTLQTVDPAAAADLFFKQKQGDLLMGVRIAPLDPAVLINNVYLPTSRTNPSGLSTDKIQSLYQQLLSTTDTATREELSHQVMKEVMANVIEMPLTSVEGYFGIATTKCVGGFPGTVIPLDFEKVQIQANCK